MRGTADRIERWSDGRLVVVDLKTGSVDEASTRCKSDWAELQKPSKAKGFQLMTYAWMLGQRYPPVSSLCAPLSPVWGLPHFVAATCNFPGVHLSWLMYASTASSLVPVDLYFFSLFRT